MNQQRPCRFKILPGMTFTPGNFNLEGWVTSIHPTEFRSESFPRMSGDVPCEVCGHDLYSHPMCGMILSTDNQPFLTVRCDGKRVKL